MAEDFVTFLRFEGGCLTREGGAESTQLSSDVYAFALLSLSFENFPSTDFSLPSVVILLSLIEDFLCRGMRTGPAGIPKCSGLEVLGSSSP